MEGNFSSYNPQLVASTLKESYSKQEHDHSGEDHHLKEEDYMSPSFNLRNISKLILPPLGVSNQNPVNSKGWIISPMDSRYRYNYLNTKKTILKNLVCVFQVGSVECLLDSLHMLSAG